jgi:molecular chaperone GrpE
MEKDLENKDLSAESVQNVITPEESSWREKFVQNLADFQNYKRQVESERLRWSKDAKARVVLAILPALDELEIALKFAPASQEFQNWVVGLNVWQESFKKTLASLGIVEIDCSGKFDPEFHEAIAEQPCQEEMVGCVVQVYRKGYLQDGVVIRHAQVAVGSV